MKRHPHTTALVFKGADVALQVTAIIYPALNGQWLVVLIALGTVQILSCIVNACVWSKQHCHKLRPVYQVLLMILFSISLFATMVSANWLNNDTLASKAVAMFIGIAMALLILSMATMYLALSIKELLHIDNLTYTPPTTSEDTLISHPHKER